MRYIQLLDTLLCDDRKLLSIQKLISKLKIRLQTFDVYDYDAQGIYV
jgi:hypothetical protein